MAPIGAKTVKEKHVQQHLMAVDEHWSSFYDRAEEDEKSQQASCLNHVVCYDNDTMGVKESHRRRGFWCSGESDA